MNAGDVKAGRPSSEAWLSSLSSDPNAALWASITPPPSPTLAMSLRRQFAKLAPDLLAQRLHLAFPHHFSSRLVAGRALLGAVAALSAGAGLAAYVVASSFFGVAPEASEAANLPAPANAVALAASAEAGHGERAAEPVMANTTERRAGQTIPDEPSQALANTAAMEPERLVEALQPSAVLEDQPRSAGSKAKKRAHAKKKVKARAKPRARARATALDAQPPPPVRAAEPERVAAPPRAKPRRQPAFKFN